MKRDIKVILSCEHGGNEVPDDLMSVFHNCDEILNTHSGYDIGALDVADFLSGKWNVPLFFSKTTRLIVDLNRTLGNRTLFSKFSKNLPDTKKHEILDKYYFPYRNKVQEKVYDAIENNFQVIHLSIHSFTPVLNGKIRNADIGILYDPNRATEKALSVEIKEKILVCDNGIAIRMNYPYKGVSDGINRFFRRIFPDENYVGIEIEMNQKHTYNNSEKFKKLLSGILPNGKQ